MKFNIFVVILALFFGYINVCSAEETTVAQNTDNTEFDMGLDETSDIQETSDRGNNKELNNDNSLMAEENVISAENSEPASIEETEEKETRFKNIEDEMSYYIENLNLTTQQMAEAKKISNDGILKQKQLLMNLYFIRKQAREIEMENLDKFKAILNAEQKVQLEQLIKLQNKQRYENEKICITNKDYKKK